MVDLIGGIIILLCALAGFFAGGITIVLETLQIVITLLLVFSFKTHSINLFSHFMSSPLFTNTAAILVLFAVIYLILSIALHFLYKFLEPFKELFLNRIFGLVGGILIGILLFYSMIGLFGKQNYFKVHIQQSYFYKLFHS